MKWTTGSEIRWRPSPRALPPPLPALLSLSLSLARPTPSLSDRLLSLTLSAHCIPLCCACRVPRSDYLGHKKKVHSVAWSCTGAKLASGSVDQTVRVWTVDEAGRASDSELKGHADSVDQLRWDPTHPEVLATASADKTVRVWDARSGKCANAIETRGENINVRWSPDAQHCHTVHLPLGP